MALFDYLLEGGPGAGADRERERRLARIKELRGPEQRPEFLEGLAPGQGGEYGLPQAPAIPIPNPMAASFTAPGGEQVFDPSDLYPQGAQPTAAPGGARALPRATGGGGGTVGRAAAAGGAAAAPAGPAQAGPESEIDRLRKQQAEAQAAQEALMVAPDRAGAEAAYQKQALGGNRQLALAMMAGEAGMQPFQAQHLKQAAAAREPMKMAGGTMTETGFIEDPAYQQELKLKRADMRSKSIDQALQHALSAEERARLQKEKLAADREMRQMMIESQQFIAGQASADRRAAIEARGEGKGKGKGGVSEATPQDMLNVISEARLHLKDATGSGIGSAIDKLAAGVGYAPAGAKATARLEPIAAKLTMMQPRMEGPQSDADRKLYESAAGRVADDTLPTERRMAALDAMEAMARKYQSGYWAPPGYKEPKGGGRRATDQGGGGGGEVDFSSLPP